MKSMSFKKAVLVVMIVFFTVLVVGGGIFSSAAIAKDNKEIGPNVVQGKVLSIALSRVLASSEDRYCARRMHVEVWAPRPVLPLN